MNIKIKKNDVIDMLFDSFISIIQAVDCFYLPFIVFIKETLYTNKIPI